MGLLARFERGEDVHRRTPFQEPEDHGLATGLGPAEKPPGLGRRQLAQSPARGLEIVLAQIHTDLRLEEVPRAGIGGLLSHLVPGLSRGRSGGLR
ncbi:hypothetical protein GCM10025784_20760 [Citricoccus nitrophenolicus]